MTKSFLPDYNTMSLGGQYRALYRLFVGDRWHIVMKDGKPVICGSASAALAVAKEHVKTILNPPIRAEKAEELEPTDVLGVDAWRAQKAAAAAQDQRVTFGGVIARRGRLVKVERRRIA